MPAFLTHWYVLIETARRSQDAGSDLGSLIVDARTLQRRAPLPAPPQTPPAGAVWDTGPLPEIDFRFPGSDISAMAYLGALAPNFGFFQKGLFREKIIKGVSPRQASDQSPATTHWAALLHTNRTGDVLRTLLEHIAEIPSPALRSQALAFAMGYTSHLATDMALNPCINALAGAYRDRRQSLAIHSYIELCLDEYVAERYFHHTLHSWTGQPWGQYIEPSASHMLQPGTLSGQVFDLLMAAAETTYGLSEVQCQSFQQTQRMGLRRLRYYLAGRGIFRALTLYALTRSRQNDPIAACIAAHSAENGTTTFEGVLAYAIRLSEHLCRRAISYYASLRNSSATASERSQRRAALSEDLRNWNLDSGYTLDVTFDQEVTVHLIHNWVHFARFWDVGEGVLPHPHMITHSPSS